MTLDPASLTERTFVDLTPGEIAAAYNVAYANYVLPFVVDAAWAASNTPRHDINPHASSVWYTPAGDIAAMAVLGQRGSDGWIGGFGIANDLRGQGLSAWLIDATIANARAAGITRLWLEVITTNAAAIRVYERAGFRHTRTMLVLRSPTDASDDSAEEQMQRIDLHTARIHRASSVDRPAWQRTIPISVDNDMTMGYCAWQTADGSGLLVTVGELPGTRIADLTADTTQAADNLLRHLRPPFIAWPTTLLNEPDGGAIATAASARGWTTALAQHEMVRDLA